MNDKDKQRKEAANRLNMLHDMLGIDKAIVSDFNKGKVSLSVEVFPGFPVGTIHLSDVPDFERTYLAILRPVMPYSCPISSLDFACRWT